MAISHIPRSVGHNFAPEYQISAVPYIVDFNADLVNTYFIKRNADNVVVGRSETIGGLVDLNGKALDTDIFEPGGDGVLQDSEKRADNLKNTFTRVEVQTLKLPKISRWIQFLPNTTGGGAKSIIVGFSRTDISKSRLITYTSDSYPLEIRCTNLYFSGNPDGKLLVGLTSIDRSEFTEVVETFLGD